MNGWGPKLTMEVTQMLTRNQKGVTLHWVLWKLEIVHSFPDVLSENIALSRHLCCVEAYGIVELYIDR